MARIERQTTISAPVATVFSYLADFPHHGEWAAHPLRIEQTSEGPVGVGTTFASVGHQMGKDHKDEVKVTEYVPNSNIAFEAVGDSGQLRHHILLQEEGQGTRLTKGMEPLQLSFPFSPLFPVLQMTGMVGGLLDGDLQRIKAKLEQGGG